MEIRKFIFSIVTQFDARGFKAADKAKISLEMSLELHGKWSEDRKDTGIMAEA